MRDTFYRERVNIIAHASRNIFKLARPLFKHIDRDTSRCSRESDRRRLASKF
jgi:hypothetical protein